MTIEQARELAERVATDRDFRERIRAADPAERREIVESEGYSLVEREHVDQIATELSESEMEAVSGGGGLDSIPDGFTRPRRACWGLLKDAFY